jgi:tetratricopeptide (TPR) repeat protein
MTHAAGTRLAFAVAGLVLLWRILAVNAVTYGDGNQPVVRIPVEGPGRPAALRAELAANPTSPSLLVSLGLEREQAGEPQEAARAFATALRVAPIDRAALQAAAALDAREGRLAQAITRIDRLLTYYGDTRETYFPVLLQLLPVPQARAALEALAREPSVWMGNFLAHACGRADPSLAATLLSRRVEAGLAAREEVRCGIDQLRRAGQWNGAYQLWLNTLPRERLADVGYVFNGGFEYAPTGIGFDWSVVEGSPAHAADFPLGSSAAGRRALRVSWTGKRIAGAALQQYLVLPPGHYEFSGQVRLEALQSVRGVQWSLRCAGETRNALGVSPRFLGSTEWERFAFAFDVPPGCQGQLLQLEPVGLADGTTYVAGRAWFDELRVTRVN